VFWEAVFQKARVLSMKAALRSGPEPAAPLFEIHAESKTLKKDLGTSKP